ncbi:chemotaxis protein CheD [Alkalithermobacter thermoalcaliphilus JW-YL-7 = DSM 7308]|uniref:Probable chemoreceptor glutamine deamidase CheD n=1 Tax=Alkalithermobacter thermoalcaliphilus JW-YL-7 = DSM 7308 TaxID=1121328 RepID=A0A150FQA3_CLOPD|nr:CheD, deamidase, stimulates methylation of MCP protein [[Clostridium] paradoxum JW-YL-7 = DSM 7308]SHK60288.1 chemotaxis protein CheD [[Clostridium] paradoxum JW-YL-7 = DSM 7308]
MKNSIKVGMADYKLGKDGDILVTLGLGSCVGIVIYDKFKKIAGMAHIMLPSSKEIRNNLNKAKFADTAIEYMLNDIINAGGSKSSLIAKIAGGAQMFKIASANESLNIGKRNVMAVKQVLSELRIPIIAEDVLGNYGRTIEFDCSTGDLTIKAIGKEKKVI